MRKIWLVAVAMFLGIHLALANPAATGLVQGPDRTNPGTYVITMPAELAMSPRDIVRIERNGVLITEARVVQVQVERMTVRPMDAKAQVNPGDTVVQVPVKVRWVNRPPPGGSHTQNAS